ncbi:hypothetical protein BC835DRAFT_1418606 [Cytidiella melzeri]|nr:hypothetical protein BC835DRAFT_1418606 [Cytidiella melzeri]
MRSSTTVVLALLATIGLAACAPLDSRAVPSDDKPPSDDSLNNNTPNTPSKEPPRADQPPSPDDVTLYDLIRGLPRNAVGAQYMVSPALASLSSLSSWREESAERAPESDRSLAKPKKL